MTPRPPIDPKNFKKEKDVEAVDSQARNEFYPETKALRLKTKPKS